VLSSGLDELTTLWIARVLDAVDTALLLALILWGQRNLNVYWDARTEGKMREAPLSVGEVAAVLIGLFIWTRSLLTMAMQLG